jgi:hypothetical protein
LKSLDSGSLANGRVHGRIQTGQVGLSTRKWPGRTLNVTRTGLPGRREPRAGPATGPGPARGPASQFGMIRRRVSDYGMPGSAAASPWHWHGIPAQAARARAVRVRAESLAAALRLAPCQWVTVAGRGHHDSDGPGSRLASASASAASLSGGRACGRPRPPRRGVGRFHLTRSRRKPRFAGESRIRPRLGPGGRLGAALPRSVTVAARRGRRRAVTFGPPRPPPPGRAGRPGSAGSVRDAARR